MINNLSESHLGRTIFVYIAESREYGSMDYSVGCTLSGIGTEGIFVKNPVTDFGEFRGIYIPFNDTHRGMIFAALLNENGERADLLISNEDYRPKARK